MNRLLSSTVARLVVAIFVLQLVSSGAAMWLLYRQMEAITFGERMKQVADVRDVMLAGYRNRGVSGIGEIISYRRKSAVDPLKFVLLEGPGFRQAILSCPVEIRAGAPPGQPVPGSNRPKFQTASQAVCQAVAPLAGPGLCG